MSALLRPKAAGALCALFVSLAALPALAEPQDMMTPPRDDAQLAQHEERLRELEEDVGRLRQDQQNPPQDVSIALKDAHVSIAPGRGYTSAIAMLLSALLLAGVWRWNHVENRKDFREAHKLQDDKNKRTDSKAKEALNVKTRFRDVAGVDEAKHDLEEIVDFLKNPGKYRALGGKMPKGALLVGPPGTGKTLLARAIAGEAGVPFFSISGSDFVEEFVGVGAARVRSMFEDAKKHKASIIFIDEIDAIGRQRNNRPGGGNEEREQTLNQILVEMDGFEKETGVILIAATNRPDILDPALLRPGRFDRQVEVSNPDLTGREKILAVHSAKVPLAADVDLRTLARGVPGFSGADLANLVNEAALFAARRGRKNVSQAEFESAKDKVLMGAERRGTVMSDGEKTMTAYHEAGHALIGMDEPHCDPVHKATILPRGRTLGVVVSLPERDELSRSKAKCKAFLKMAMGGRAAEELVFGADNVGNGAAGDIQQATRLATAMAAKWGMSDAIGMVEIPDERMGERTVQAEVKKLIDEAYQAALSHLTAHRETLDLFAQKLLTHETLSGEQLQALKDGGDIGPPVPFDTASIAETASAGDDDPEIDRIYGPRVQRPRSYGDGLRDPHPI